MGGCTIRSGVAVIVWAKRLSGKRGQNHIAKGSTHACVWGVLWGITGMILSVPITVIMVIIFAQFEATRPVAIMLSEKGQIDGGRKRPRKEEKIRVNENSRRTNQIIDPRSGG